MLDQKQPVIFTIKNLINRLMEFTIIILINYSNFFSTTTQLNLFTQLQLKSSVQMHADYLNFNFYDILSLIISTCKY